VSIHAGLSRRRFIGAGALGVGAVLAERLSAAAWAAPTGETRIADVQVSPIRYPTIGRFKFFEGPPGTPSGRAAAVVKLTASDGTVGWGQSVPIPKWSDETLEGAVTALRVYLTPVLVGRDPFDIAGAHAAMDAAIAPAFSTGMPITKAGVDLALHDLAGRLSGQEISARWGQPRGGPLTLSWTLNPKDLAETEALIQQGRDRGYRHFNVKVAPDPAYDLELCRIVRQAAPECFLWADANGGYDPATALEVAPELADLGVDVLESPLRPNRIAGYQDLRRQGALPILMDEGVISPQDLIEFIRLDMLDGVAMKPARCGGLHSARRQIEILRDAGLMVLGSGLTDPDLSLAASLILFGAYGISQPCALNGPQFLGDSIAAQPLLPAGDGTIAVPTGPGLGLRVDEAKLAALAAA